MKLADMLDLGSNAKACRFKSCHPHQSIQTRTFPIGETFGFIVFLNEIAQFKKNVHSAVLSGRWCGDQRPLCGPAAGECQSVEFGFITTV